MLLFGAGFGSDEGLILSGSIAQQNIFGSGRHLSLNRQYQQDQHDLLAVLHQPLLHGGRREPGL